MLRVNNCFDHVCVINIERLRDRYDRLRPRLERLGIEHERFEGVDGLAAFPEPRVIPGNLFRVTYFDMTPRTKDRSYWHRAGNVETSDEGLYCLSLDVRFDDEGEIAVRYWLAQGDHVLRYGTAKMVAGHLGWQRLRWEVYKQPEDAFDSVSFLLLGSPPDRVAIRDPELLKTDYRQVLSRGTLGCKLSHIAVVQDAKSRGFGRILCMEDDVFFHREFPERFSAVFPHVPDDWRLLYIGCKQRARQWDKILVHDPGWYRAIECNGLHAYGIDQRLFDDFVAVAKKHRLPVDLAMHQLQETHPSYVFFPNLAAANEMESSTQEKSREDARRIQEPSRWNMSEYDI